MQSVPVLARALFVLKEGTQACTDASLAELYMAAITMQMVQHNLENRIERLSQTALDSNILVKIIADSVTVRL